MTEIQLYKAAMCCYPGVCGLNPDDEVLTTAEELGEELRSAQQESTQFEFDLLLLRCNNAITEEIGVDSGSVCDTDDCC